MSSFSVLFVNDIFYNLVFRKKILTKDNVHIWEEIKPMEIFGTGAKKTFITNKITHDVMDENKKYHEYIQFNKQDAELENSHKLNDNIFDKKN